MRPHADAVAHLGRVLPRLSPPENHSNFDGSEDHCADMLRQKVMCDADVGVITYNWHENNSDPVANFNTPHKCRNFDRVLDWSYRHQTETPDGRVHKPKDAIVAPYP